MKVQFGFSTSEWWVSRLIRRATKGKCSHAFVLLHTGMEAPLDLVVLEAWWDGWRMTTFDVERRQSIVALLDAPAGFEDAALSATRASLKWLGTSYDYKGLLGMAWVSLCRWLGKKVRNPLRSAHSMFCSEAAVLILQAAQWPEVRDLDAQSVDPEQLLELLLLSGVDPRLAPPEKN